MWMSDEEEGRKVEWMKEGEPSLRTLVRSKHRITLVALFTLPQTNTTSNIQIH
jgi:hypothetical protein